MIPGEELPLEDDVTRWDEWPEATLVVIACSASKLQVPARASQLYTGSLFVLALRAARAIVDDSWVRVLSGKHGLLGLDEELWPYEQRIDEPGAVAADVVAQQIAAIEPLVLVALTPSAYTRRLQDASTVPVVRPLNGARGIGEIRRRLVTIERTVQR